MACSCSVDLSRIHRKMGQESDRLHPLVVTLLLWLLILVSSLGAFSQGAILKLCVLTDPGVS